MDEKDKKRITADMKNDTIFVKYDHPTDRHECKQQLKALKAKQVNGPFIDIPSEPPEELLCQELGDRIERVWVRDLNRKEREHVNLSHVMFKTFAREWIEQILMASMSRLLPVIFLLESVKQLLNHLESEFSPGAYKEAEMKPVPEEHVSFNELKEQLELIGNATDLIEVTPILNSGLALETLISARLLLRIFYSTLVAASLVYYFLMYSKNKFSNALSGLRCRIALTQLIQRKSLRLKHNSGPDYSSSRAMSLVSNEVQAIEEANKYLIFTIQGPISIIGGTTWLAVRQTGWIAALAPLPLVALLIIFNLWLLRKDKEVKKRRRETTNKRIEATNSFLSSIKVIKMYAWEKSFRDKIEAFRSAELKLSKKLDFITSTDYITYITVQRLFSTITFIVCVNLAADSFNIQTLFISSMCYRLFAVDYVLYFSRGLKSLGDFIASCKNIKSYLLLDEVVDQRLHELPRGYKPSLPRVRLVCRSLDVAIAAPKREADIGLVEIPLDTNLGTIEYAKRSDVTSCEEPAPKDTDPSIIIKDLNLELQEGELAIVIGPIGSGKTTLLMSLLGETWFDRGSVTYTEGASFAYASQDPWLLAESFKDNILMGRPFEAQRYKEVISVCSLRRDIDLLPQGDETQVGPKGVSLSGGQKARLSLARAIYSRADIFLLDDPLSAVDPRVANHIFTECISSYLRNKIVVLATHQMQFLSRAGKLIMLEQGKPPVVGAASDVLAREDMKQLVERLSSVNNQAPDATISKHQLIDLANTREDKQTKKVIFKTMSLHEPTDEKKKSSSIYLYFLALGFSRFGTILTIISLLLFGVSSNTIDFYFRVWSRQVISDLKNTTLTKDEYVEHLHDSLLINLATIITCAIMSAIYLSQLARGLRRASTHLHSRLMDSLFNARMSFYDVCQIGELSSRYATAFASGENILVYVLTTLSTKIIITLGSCVIYGFINPISFIFLGALYATLIPVSKKMNKHLRALRGQSKSLVAPILTHLSTMAEDPTTVRSDVNYIRCGKEKFEFSQNKATSMSLVTLSYEARTAVVLELILTLVIYVFLVTLFVVFEDEMDVPNTGMFLVLTFGPLISFPFMIDYFTKLESSMGAIEKVRQFTVLEPETDAPQEAAHQRVVPKRIEWPNGQITFSNVTLKYTANCKPVLDHLSFSVRGGERIGVVGRTGAGKSSIVGALYRLYPFEGFITIDDTDIGSLDLDELRSSLGVIPQEPVLFCDTLRKNLDPFGIHTDAEIWRALEVVNLHQHIVQSSISGLSQQISEGGRNFSAGQRQLICLARAILRNPKILLIDEATANVDPDTDALIQRTIKSHFASCTILTIAHRLNTILDYDRILVLDAGKIVEFDTVESLRAKEGGLFRTMLQASSNS